MGIAHFDEAPSRDFELGHLRGRWTALGQAAGTVTVGVRRIEVPAGGWSTPLHEHGVEEEIFYILSGRGLSWQGDRTSVIGSGDCIVYLPGHGAHSIHALEPIDLLAFGTRERDESPRFPRLGLSLVGNRAVETEPGSIQGVPIQFIRESQLGPPELPPDPSARPETIVNLEDVTPQQISRPRMMVTRRDLGRSAGSVRTGLKHIELAPGTESMPPHCHSLEEEIFVLLGGDGVLILGEEETAVRRGHVVGRPAGTGVAHMFRAGSEGLVYLAYGTRDPGDICYYPRSNKIAFRGVGLIARLERLDYWDGEG